MEEKHRKRRIQTEKLKEMKDSDRKIERNEGFEAKIWKKRRIRNEKSEESKDSERKSRRNEGIGVKNR